MKNLFSPARFGRLFRKHTAEHGKAYLLSIGVLLGVLALFIGGNAYAQDAPIVPGQQAAYFGFFLIVGGLLFTSTVFANFGDKKQAISALMLPASHFEKYLVGWLYSFVLFTLTFVGCFYLVDGLVVHLDNWHGKPVQLLNLFSEEPKVYPIFFAYAFLHAVAIWGALFFEKLQLVKTAFVFFLTIVVVALLNYQFVKLLIEHVSGAMLAPFAAVDLAIGKENYLLSLPDEQHQLLGLVPMVIGLLFWATAYLRVKEKEI